MMSEKEKAWRKFVFDKTNSENSSMLGGFYRGFRNGFNTGFDAGVKVERERIKKIFIEKGYTYERDCLFTELFPNEGGEV